jgi:serine/threonine protein kinase
MINCNTTQVRQLLRALQYMHEERGIMHGDIKPDNLLLVGSSFPCSPLPLNNYCSAVLKIADFGLAKQLQVRVCF